jgi:hypothetical protein
MLNDELAFGTRRDATVARHRLRCHRHVYREGWRRSRILLAGAVASGAMQSIRYGRGLLVLPVSQAANDGGILLLRAFDDDALSLQRNPIFAGAEDTF